MKAKFISQGKEIELDLSQVKRISAVSQCNLLVTKCTGEQLIGNLLEFN